MEEPTKMIVPHTQHTCVKYIRVASEIAASQPPPPRLTHAVSASDMPQSRTIGATNTGAIETAHQEAPDVTVPDQHAKKGDDQTGRVLP